LGKTLGIPFLGFPRAGPNNFLSFPNQLAGHSSFGKEKAHFALSKGNPCLLLGQKANQEPFAIPMTYGSGLTADSTAFNINNDIKIIFIGCYTKKPLNYITKSGKDKIILQRTSILP